jgi:hypothetical protein
MASNESPRKTRKRSQEQPLPVDADFARIPVDDTFLTGASTESDVDEAGKPGASVESSSPSRGHDEEGDQSDLRLEVDAVEPIEPKLPEKGGKTGASEVREKSAILARISQSVREIENRSTGSGIDPTADAIEGKELGGGEKDILTGDAGQLPPPREAVVARGENVAVRAKKESSEGGAPGKAGTQISAEGPVGVEASADSAAEAESKRGVLSAGRHAGVLEAVEPALGMDAKEGQKKSRKPDDAMVSSGVEPGDEAAIPQSWRDTAPAMREKRFSYGRVFLLCYLLPTVVLVIGVLLAKDAIRSFFAGEKVEEQASALSVAEEVDGQGKKLEELGIKLAAIEAELAAQGDRISEKMPNVDEEIEYLRVRNKLTTYADEAITMANRAQYKKLWDVVYDETQGKYHAAAVSEILRVKFFYASGSRLGAWTLPVRELFPGLETEGDLQVQQVIELLLDRTQDWRVRVRAARLLEGQRTRRVLEKLREAIHDDPNLDVLKEAVRTFEVNAGFVGGDFFDVESVDNWWEANSEKFEEEGGS